MLCQVDEGLRLSSALNDTSPLRPRIYLGPATPSAPWAKSTSVDETRNINSKSSAARGVSWCFSSVILVLMRNMQASTVAHGFPALNVQRVHGVLLETIRRTNVRSDAATAG